MMKMMSCRRCYHYCCFLLASTCAFCVDAQCPRGATTSAVMAHRLDPSHFYMPSGRVGEQWMCFDAVTQDKDLSECTPIARLLSPTSFSCCRSPVHKITIKAAWRCRAASDSARLYIQQHRLHDVRDRDGVALAWSPTAWWPSSTIAAAGDEAAAAIVLSFPDTFLGYARVDGATVCINIKTSVCTREEIVGSTVYYSMANSDASCCHVGSIQSIAQHMDPLVVNPPVLVDG
jgi:hypothetical protein